MGWQVIKVNLPTGQQVTFLISFDPNTKTVSDPECGEPMNTWLREHGESPVIYTKHNDAWVEIKDPANAIMFKLMWGGK
jgi:hypothetical protein